MTAEPTSIVEVWAASQARTVGLSEPYASDAQTTEKPGLGVLCQPQLPTRIIGSDQIAEVEPKAHARHASAGDASSLRRPRGASLRVAGHPTTLAERRARQAVRVSPMETRQVGCSGLRVSRLGLGTMTWGRDTPAENAHALLEMFCEAGGTLIDTAAAYGAGDAERIVGRLVRELGNRDEVVIATKAGFVIRDGKRIVDTSRRALLRDLDGSLRRLQSDYIDLWQIHAWGEAPVEESLDAIDYAVSTGRVRYAGVSNFVGWQTAQAATWQRAFPGRTPDHQCSGRVLPARAPGRGRGAPGRAGLWHGFLSVVTTRPRRADRAVPEWHAPRIAGGD